MQVYGWDSYKNLFISKRTEIFVISTNTELITIIQITLVINDTVSKDEEYNVHEAWCSLLNWYSFIWSSNLCLPSWNSPVHQHISKPHQWALPNAGCSHSTLSQTISLTFTIIQSSHPCPCDPNTYFPWRFLISTVYMFYIIPFMLPVLFISFSFI